MWPALDDFNAIIYLSLLVLIMGMAYGFLADDFPIERVTHFSWDLYSKSLRRLCAGDDTNESLFQRFTLFRLQFHVHEVL